MLERGLLTAEQLDEILSIENLMNPQYKAKRYPFLATRIASRWNNDPGPWESIPERVSSASSSGNWLST